ncbi:dihydrodipicolinate synthase family protein [Yeosuana marina]|uniref:dihydrodipicolinate synthase family protein n=1 Tax=Yeosuana marina TaxID=1565536 RepID=UPI0030C7C597
MKLVLKGIIPPMITPLSDNGELDIEGLKRLIEHLISGGVHGIFLLGTNGEAPSLTYKLRKELITKACAYIAKRVPVLVGITDTSLEHSLEIAEHSKKAGADAVVIAPPYYFPISQNEMRDYLDGLVPHLPLPFLLYNMPGCTKLHLSIETVQYAKSLGAIGVKDSSGDLEYSHELIDVFKEDSDFAVIIGTEAFLSDTINYGGHGAIAGGANFYPKLFVDIYNASLKQDLPVITELNKKVKYIYDTIYSVGKYESRITKGTKCALSVMDICNDYMALPLRSFEDREREEIKRYIQKLNIK